MRIGVFDSGIGGLSVLKTLLEKYPNNEYIYYGDTINIPYGNKTKEELFKLAINDMDFLINKRVDMIVIACGTISSTFYQDLLDRYSLPIYDIISPMIRYLNSSKYKKIGIIATHNTINTHIFKNNIKRKVFEIETPKLVPLIENNELDKIETILSEYLEPYKDKIDSLVLGCTHYPIIIDKIDKHFDGKIPIFNMANYLFSDFENLDSSKLIIYFSKINSTIINNTKRIIDSDNIEIKLATKDD